jgi:hypothetical protein
LLATLSILTLWRVRALKCILGLALVVAFVVPAFASEPRIMKVLPQFLDAQGRATLSPSLYERDAYQAQLRSHPEQRSGIRFAIQWRAPSEKLFKLRVEMRGNRNSQPTTATVEESVRYHGWFGAWGNPALTGEAYRRFGELIAWRATLWDGDKLVSEQKSFLW